MSRPRTRRVWDTNVLAELLMPEGDEELSVQGFRRSARTISINPESGRVRVTATYRGPDGVRAVLRVTRMFAPRRPRRR